MLRSIKIALFLKSLGALAGATLLSVTLFGAATLGAVALSSAPAWADEALRGKVLDLLSAYEETPTAEQWARLGPDVATELQSIATDPSVSASRRARAVHALGYFPSSERQALLKSIVSDSKVDAATRRSACYALANGWGDAALPLLEGALSDPDLQLRNTAVLAVSRIGTPAARGVLEGRLQVEADPMVSTTLKTALGR